MPQSPWPAASSSGWEPSPFAGDVQQQPVQPVVQPQQLPQAAAAPPAVAIEPPETGGWFVVWQWSDGQSNWNDYEPDFITKLENHYEFLWTLVAGDPARILEFYPKANVKFTYDLDEMVQTNTRSGMKRMMRRCLVSPGHWRKESAKFHELEAYNNAHHQPRAGLPPRGRSRSGSRQRSATPSRRH